MRIVWVRNLAIFSLGVDFHTLICFWVVLTFGACSGDTRLRKGISGGERKRLSIALEMVFTCKLERYAKPHGRFLRCTIPAFSFSMNPPVDWILHRPTRCSTYNAKPFNESRPASSVPMLVGSPRQEPQPRCALLRPPSARASAPRRTAR